MESSEQIEATPQQMWRVLVVDDEVNLNWSVVNSLRRANFVADGALNAEDARRRLTEQAYDCVVSDVQMPGIDGFQLLNWLREWRPSTRVIMMTAFGSPSVRQEAYSRGVVAYLEKPVDLRTLRAEIRRTLETRPQQPSSYDLIDITQAINVARRDIVAQVLAAGQTGMLAFERGDLIAAEYGTLRGNEAYLAMCAVPAERIWQATPAAPPERNVTEPVSALIFEALLARNAQPPVGSPAPVGSLAPVGSSPSETGSAATGAPSGTGSLNPPRLTAQPAATPPAQPVSPPPAQVTAGQMRLVESSRMDAQRALSGLVVTIGAPCAVALLTSSGAVKAVAQTAHPPASEEVFANLAQAMQATARAARAGQWGAVREARLVTGERQALVRLLNGTAESLALVVVTPIQVDQRQIEAAIAAHQGALRSLTAL